MEYGNAKQNRVDKQNITNNPNTIFPTSNEEMQHVRTSIINNGSSDE
jgi:hypothetical protein